MKIRYARIAFLMALCLSIPAVSQLADGGWPMFGHDLQHTGKSPYAGPDRPVVDWFVNRYVPAANGSSPVIGPDGTVFIVGDGWKLQAFHPDGSPKWTFDRRFDSGTPAVGNDGTVYAASLDSSLCAIRPDGTLKWSFRTGEYVRTPPAIAADGTVYIGSWDRYFYAIRPDGSEKWKYETGDRITTAPALNTEGDIYFGSWDGVFHCLRPDGSLKFTYQAGGGIGMCSPAVGSDGTVYFGADDARFYALNPDGTLKWAYALNTSETYQLMASPSIGPDGTVYFAARTNMFTALNPDGSLKWFYPIDATGSKPVVDRWGHVYIGAYDGSVYAFLPDGSLKWSFNIGTRILSNPALDDKCTLYVLSGSGEGLHAIGDSLMHDGTGVAGRDPAAVRAFRLCRNYPNPFNASTRIPFSQARPGRVSVDIFDLRGVKVASLMDGLSDAGEHSIVWNADGFPGGTYLVRLEAEGVRETGKLVLLK